MALISCPECGKKRVSDSALACPSCGFNIKEYLEKQRLANNGMPNCEQEQFSEMQKETTVTKNFAEKKPKNLNSKTRPLYVFIGLFVGFLLAVFVFAIFFDFDEYNKKTSSQKETGEVSDTFESPLPSYSEKLLKLRQAQATYMPLKQITPAPSKKYTPTDTAETSSSREYVLNTNTKKFHRTTCDSVSQMNEEHKLYSKGKSKEEILELGYEPCQLCCP